MPNLGAWVKTERTRRKWLQSRLADEADLAQSYISKIERGSVRVSLETMRQLANAFKIPLDKALADSGWLEGAIIVSQLRDAGTPEQELLELESIWFRLPAPMRKAILASGQTYISAAEAQDQGAPEEAETEPSTGEDGEGEGLPNSVSKVRPHVLGEPNSSVKR